MRFISTIIVATAVCSLLASVVDGAGPEIVGRKMEPFQLQDFRGATLDSAIWNRQEVVVVAFLGAECPLAKHYGVRLAELASRYKSKNVGFVAIDANEQDTLVEMAQYARVSKIEFPFLKDPSNRVADLFGAQRTPEVFVLDRQQVVRYHGRVDDQYGIGYRRDQPKREDLALAIDELLANKAVSTPTTPVAGCHIGRVHRGDPRGEITYAKEIAPLIQKHCVDCHRSGEIGPFALTTYEDVVNWSSTIREVVQDQRMPPWHADSDAGTFVNDRRLPDVEKKLLFDWIDNGMPVGNTAELPEPRQFVEGWQIPQPDLVLEMDQSYDVPAKGTVEYQYFPIKADFPEDRWIVASEARPGNRAVVHHLILFYVPPGFKGRVEQASLEKSVATFAPGMPAWQAPTGMARRIPAGSKLYLQAHYTPNGVATTDLSKVGLVFANPEKIDKQLLTEAAVNFRLRIPPQTDNVLMKAEYGFRQDMLLISLMPHMHLRGKAFRIEAVEKNGERKLLLDVPHYDFNWQNLYVFHEPLLMREGTMLQCSAWYNNTDKNPANPDPTKTVGWGDQTWEEMLVAQLETVLADQHLLHGLPKSRRLESGEYEVEFNFRPGMPADAVVLAGNFNGWKPADHRMDGPDKERQLFDKNPLEARCSRVQICDQRKCLAKRSRKSTRHGKLLKQCFDTV